MSEHGEGSTPRAASRGAAAGILLIIAAVLCFSGMDASAKWLGPLVHPVQLIGFRYGLSFLLVALFFNPWTKPGLLRSRNPRLQWVRGLFVVISTVGGWTAVRYMPLTKLTSISFTAPLMVALLAGPMLGEKIGPRRLVAVAVGFAGVLVVTRPFDGHLDWAVLVAFTAAVANALFSILTRRLAAFDQPETTMFYTGLVGSVVMLPGVPFVWETPTGPRVWIVMVLLGTLGAVAHWLLILAHRLAPASTLAPFYYTQIIGAVALGVIVFGDVPDLWTIVGSAIVTGSGLYLFYRERVRKKPVPSADVV